MNIVAHMTECKPHSTVASARVARFIAETLPDFRLVDTREKTNLVRGVLSMSQKALKHLIIVNGPMAFCDFLPELAALVRVAENVVFVQQDYTIMPPSAESKAESPFRKVFADRKLRPHFWTTVKDNVRELGDHYVNWNQLTYDLHKPADLVATPTLMYYGAYREKREQDFQFYFQDAPYNVHISTTPIRGKKFLKLDSRIKIVPPWVGLGDLPRCRASLYIEDRKSHEEFHSPANRFYELLSAGIPILFDVRTTKQLAIAGINPKPNWVVKSKADVFRILTTSGECEAIRCGQRELWCRDYVSELRNYILEIWENYKR
jgi:hypothetical protein